MHHEGLRRLRVGEGGSWGGGGYGRNESRQTANVLFQVRPVVFACVCAIHEMAPGIVWTVFCSFVAGATMNAEKKESTVTAPTGPDAASATLDEADVVWDRTGLPQVADLPATRSHMRHPKLEASQGLWGNRCARVDGSAQFVGRPAGSRWVLGATARWTPGVWQGMHSIRWCRGNALKDGGFSGRAVEGCGEPES